MSPIRCTRAAASLAILLAVSLATPVHAQYFGRNKVQYEAFDFQKLTTEHFDLYYYPGERLMAEQAARMAERWYARLSKAFDAELHGRQPLILYASHPDFEQTNAIPGELDESTGGVTESFKRRIVLPLAGSLAETDHVIGHELVHAFQYDLHRKGESNPFDSGTQLPLWFIEGMAEYFSIGPHDPHTAMWLRDAALAHKLPTIAKLDNPKYFPYRFGQAFWAYVAARFGENAVGQTMKTASGRGGQAEQAIAATLGVPVDSLSRDWQRAIERWAGVEAAAPAPEGKVTGRPSETAPALQGHAVISPQGERGRINVGPSLNPDGTKIAFLSERDQFSIELFVADAKSGHVIQRLTRTSVDPHLQSLQFIYSAGDWSPDGKRIAIATVSGGKPQLTILDAGSGRTVREIELDKLGEIFQPTWSPDGTKLAFSASANGTTDLYTIDLASKRLEQLTDDLYSDQQPTWSPDGKSLAFVTDRFTTQLENLTYGDPRLAWIDLATHAIHEVPGTKSGKNIDPQWSPDGSSLFFLSDRGGITNVYRAELGNGSVTQITDVPTGVSGITSMSPALSVARRSGGLAFAVYDDMGYQIRTLDAAGLAGFAPRSTGESSDVGTLPPPRTDAAITAEADAALPSVLTFKTGRYKAGLSLDHASQAGIGLSTGSGGVGVGGGSAFYWSDMLGDHNLATFLQMGSSEGGISKNLALLADYQNRSHRAGWGLQGYQIPYFSRQFVSDEGTFSGEPAVRYQDVRAWQIERSIEASVSYPVSRVQRFELGTGYRNIDFSGEIQSQIYSINTGELLSDTTTPSSDDSIPSISLFTGSAAAVYDNSIFGGTSPVSGQRYRLELSPVVGDLQFATVLADYRRYQRLAGPLGLAGRLVHIGRYGRDSESTRISSLFLGYPWLIRGYDAESFTVDECQTGDCQEFAQLFGSRIGVANVELRLPLLGALGLLRSPGVPPVEAAGFFDTGVAWTDAESARFLGGSRSAVSSYGTVLRVNLLGFAVAEIAYVHPNDRPLKGWYWQFNLQPGF